MPVFDWKEPVCDREVPVFDWQVPVFDLKVLVFDWQVNVFGEDIPCMVVESAIAAVLRAGQGGLTAALLAAQGRATPPRRPGRATGRCPHGRPRGGARMESWR